ncbi:DUF6544 family protein [Mesobacterium pallidum]|uniref:DUF6544 family protein n=1 Tax=Mesobacterium pallidum TaxID=2872037 RepID=UPI001EE174D4|nr:DUF6544 family protein [Mesobacterium pallidum]
MKLIGLVLLALIALSVLIWGFGAWRLSRLASGLRAEILSTPPGEVPDLPAPVRDWARRMGAMPGAARVEFDQRAEMELKPGGGWQAITARQVIGLGAPDFLWQAEMRLGPVPLVRVIDAHVGGRGLLTVRALGALPIGTVQGPDADLGEAMRYLAELPWAPDAALSNPALRWQVLAPDHWRVGLDGGAAVDLFLDAAGDVVRISAKARPATDPQGQPTTYDWEGHFTDHAQIGGRRIPRRGEVGYIRDGTYAPYFRGEITEYRVLR